jgi:hypothetical protein
MFVAIHRSATTRNLLAAFVALGIVTLLSDFVVIPVYRGFASGLTPLNLQYRLTWEMIAIQRGTFSPGIETAYLAFAVLDLVWQAALAVFLALLWAWIMDRSPRPLASDMWLLYPVIPALLGIAESIGISRLVLADSHLPLHDLTDAVLSIHRYKFFFREGNVVVTVLLALWAMYFRWRAAHTKPSE